MIVGNSAPHRPKNPNNAVRICTLNIRHGGGQTDRRLKVVNELLRLRSDIMVVTEFRNNSTGAYIKAALNENGYDFSHPKSPANANSVLIAWRNADGPGSEVTEPLNPNSRIHEVKFDHFSVCAVYLPNGKEKLPFWEMLVSKSLKLSRPTVFIGDFNTGRNDLDKAKSGVKFIASEYMDRLALSGKIDLYRAMMPTETEYSWYSGRGNGFRIDHAFGCETIKGRLISCTYDHTARLNGTTDHAALVVELSKP